MKRALALLLAIAPLTACTTDDPADPETSTDTAALDAPCLEYCHGRPFERYCVPVCRKEGKVFIGLDVKPFHLLVCGDHICDLPAEGLDGTAPCKKDCFRELVIDRQVLRIAGKEILTADDSGLRLHPAAFDLDGE